MRLACCSYETSPQSGTAGGIERSAARRFTFRPRSTTIRAASLCERAAKVERERGREGEMTERGGGTELDASID